jgi:hypothetical protein
MQSKKIVMDMQPAKPQNGVESLIGKRNNAHPHGALGA